MPSQPGRVRSRQNTGQVTSKNLTVLDTTQSKANNQAKIVNDCHRESIFQLFTTKERRKKHFQQVLQLKTVKMADKTTCWIPTIMIYKNTCFGACLQSADFQHRSASSTFNNEQGYPFHSAGSHGNLCQPLEILGKSGRKIWRAKH